MSVEGLALPDIGNRVPRNAEYLRETDGDEKLFVKFYKNAVTGKDHIEIRTPGEDFNVIDAEADVRYQQRFRRQWDAYKNELDEFAGQTRIETVAWVDPGLVGALKHQHIHTVEALAGVSDAALSAMKMPGMRTYRDRAIKHLEESKKSAEYNDLKAELAALREQVNAAPAPKRRGRPPKVVPATA